MDISRYVGISWGRAKKANRLATVMSARLKRSPERWRRLSASVLSSQSSSDSRIERLSAAASGVMSCMCIMMRRLKGHIAIAASLCGSEALPKSPGLASSGYRGSSSAYTNRRT